MVFGGTLSQRKMQSYVFMVACPKEMFEMFASRMVTRTKHAGLTGTGTKRGGGLNVQALA